MKEVDVRNIGYSWGYYREPSSSHQLSRPPSGLAPRRGRFSHESYGESPQARRERLAELRERFQPRVESPFGAHELGNPDLPAYKHKTEIIQTIAENKISWLCGPTGSGKTTQLVQYALEAGYDQVVCLMPRRVIVDNVEEYVRQSLEERLGDDYPPHLVGKVHGRAVTETPDTRLRFMTAATLSKKLATFSEDWQQKKVLVVADEIHEANLEMEFATALVAREVQAHDDWRLVLASATPDTDTPQEMYHTINQGALPVVEIEGRPHDIQLVEDAERDVAEAYIAHGSDSKKALVFVEGVRSIDETISAIKRGSPGRKIRFFKLHSGISPAARHELFRAIPADDESIVVVSTSAGQSGITIPKIDLVVSNGITKSKEIGEEGAEGLPPRLCTQAELTQQAGRGGRDVAGATFVLARPVAYRKIYVPDELKRFHPTATREQYIPPEIYHTNIVRNVLSAIRLAGDFRELNQYLWHRVDNEMVICQAHDLLDRLGAIDEDNRITKIGEFMDDLPLTPELSRSLAEAVQTGCSLREILALAAVSAAVSGGGFADWHKPKDVFWEYVGPDAMDDMNSEYIAFLKTREIYQKNGYADGREYLEHGIDPNKADAIHYQFNKICRRLDLNPHDVDMDVLTSDEWERVATALTCGFRDLIYHQVGSRRVARQDIPRYQNIHSGEQGIDEYEISSRSITTKLGREALKIVVALPWWYDTHDGRHYTLNTVLPVTKDIIKRALVSDAFQLDKGCQLAPNGDLVRLSLPSVGCLEVGAVQQQKIAATTDEHVRLLVEGMRRQPEEPVLRLLRLQHQKQLRPGVVTDILHQAARGSHNVHEAAARVWSLVQTELPEAAVEAFYGAGCEIFDLRYP